MIGCMVLGGFLSAVFAWSAGILVLGLLRSARKHSPATRPLRFAVVICARNEARVIRDSVESVLAAEYPPSCREVFVLADNCTDATAARATAAGAIVWEKGCPSQCKGDVLAWGLKRLYERGGFDAVAVFDADNRVSSGWFTAMNAALQDGECVVTGRRGATNPRANVISGWYTVYWELLNELSNRVRTNLGLSAKLTGTGFAFRASVLDGTGWGTRTLVEDVEFTLQVNLAGRRVAYVPEAAYDDEQPIACGPMWRQLKRWATGGRQVLAGYAWAWLTALCKQPSLRLFDAYFVLLTGFSLAFVCLFGLVRMGWATAWHAVWGGFGFAVCVTLALALGARMLSPREGRPGWGALVTFPVFSLVLVLSVLASLVHPTRRWHTTPHLGHVMNDEE